MHYHKYVQNIQLYNLTFLLIFTKSSLKIIIIICSISIDSSIEFPINVFVLYSSNSTTLVVCLKHSYVMKLDCNIIYSTSIVLKFINIIIIIEYLIEYHYA